MAVGLVLGSSGMLAQGCSTPPTCDPAIPESAEFRVTLKDELPLCKPGETQDVCSDQCHIVQALRISPFQMKAGKAAPTAARPDCSASPAAGPPDQTYVTVYKCTPSLSDMLGTYCTIRYPAGCDGAMTFYFTAPSGTAIDWKAQVIENAHFHIQDYANSCLPDKANCSDVYNAKLERTK